MSHSNRALSDQKYSPFEEPLELGKEHLLKCSSCETELVSIQVTRPNRDFKNRFVAKCWKCEDKSFIAEVIGGIHYSHTKASIVLNLETIDDLTTFETAENKGGDDGKSY